MRRTVTSSLSAPLGRCVQWKSGLTVDCARFVPQAQLLSVLGGEPWALSAAQERGWALCAGAAAADPHWRVTSRNLAIDGKRRAHLRAL